MSSFNIRAADRTAQAINGGSFDTSPTFRASLPKPNQAKSDGKETMWAKVQRQRKEGHPKFKGGRFVDVPLEIESPFVVIKGCGNQTTKAKELKRYEEALQNSEGRRD